MSNHYVVHSESIILCQLYLIKTIVNVIRKISLLPFGMVSDKGKARIK